MNTQKKEEMKKVTDQILKELSKSGIKAQQVAVFDMDETNGEVPQSIIDMFKGTGKTKDTEINKNEEEDDDESCTCSGCLNFHTAEEILKDATFENKQVALAGKNWHLKYALSKEHGEFVFIEPVGEGGDKFKVPNNWNLQTITRELEIAVTNKDFEKAQTLVNALKTKNKN